jgi:starch phosphorylase
VREEMQRGHLLVGAENGYLYLGEVSASRPVSHYRARIMARRDGVAVPMEAYYILWQEE